MKFLRIICLMFLASISVAKADDFTITMQPGANNFGISLEPGWSGNAIFMTNYIQRGISQTFGQKIQIKLGKYSMGNMAPALNLSETYQFDNGIFLSVGGSNSNQANNGYEADFTAGYIAKLSDTWLYQTSVAYQSYPGASNFANVSSVEFQNIANYVQPWGKVVMAFAFQPQAQDHAGWYTYSSIGADYSLPNDFTIGGRIGYNTNSNHSVAPNYVDWTVTLSKSITKDISASLQYTNSNNHIQTGNGQHLVAMLSFSF